MLISATLSPNFPLPFKLPLPLRERLGVGGMLQRGWGRHAKQIFLNDWVLMSSLAVTSCTCLTPPPCGGMAGWARFLFACSGQSIPLASVGIWGTHFPLALGFLVQPMGQIWSSLLGVMPPPGGGVRCWPQRFQRGPKTHWNLCRKMDKSQYRESFSPTTRCCPGCAEKYTMNGHVQSTHHTYPPGASTQDLSHLLISYLETAGSNGGIQNLFHFKWSV